MLTPEVLEIYETLEPFDIMLKLRTNNVDVLREIIGNISGIQGILSTNTILTTKKIMDDLLLLLAHERAALQLDTHEGHGLQVKDRGVEQNGEPLYHSAFDQPVDALVDRRWRYVQFLTDTRQRSIAILTQLPYDVQVSLVKVAFEFGAHLVHCRPLNNITIACYTYIYISLSSQLIIIKYANYINYLDF
jgi:hypothetical protein